MVQFNGVEVPVRDAGATIGVGHITPSIILKTIDETVNNSVTFQTDDVLGFAVGANETWVFEGYLFTSGDATADLKIQVVGPAGSTIVGGALGQRTADVVVTSNPFPATLGNGVATGGWPVHIFGTVVTGATAGRADLQWAQAVQTVADTIVKANSFLRATRVS